MKVKLTWLGHGTWSIEADSTTLLLDPFLDEQPTAPVKSADVTADYILISHGHFDHVADAASIAQRCDATIISNYEITTWFEQQHGIAKTEPMNLGGSISLPFGKVKLTSAWHSSQLPDGSYGGNPGGFLLTFGEQRIYFACDTALFPEMQWLSRGGLDAAIVPIGDRFTMGPEDSVAATKLLKPRVVLPAHYNTWPPIEQDAASWAQRIRQETEAEPVVLAPGDCYTL